MARPISQGGIDYQDGGFSSGGPVYPLVGDLAELAGRLGSQATYDRRGNVVFLSNFDHGLSQFSRSAAGTGAEQRASNEACVTGAYSLRMLTSNVTNEVSTAQTSIPIPSLTTRMGFEAAVSIPGSEVQFAISIAVYHAPDFYQYTLTYRTDDDRLFITSPTGSGILENSLAIREGVTAWHKVKIVADLENNMYVRALFDRNEYDVSDYAAYHSTTTEADRIDIRLLACSRDNTNRVVYWDDVVVTQNEPSQPD